MQIVYAFCISKIVRTFGFKGRQLLLTGNSFFCSFAGGSHQLVTSFWKRVQIFVEKSD